MSGFAQLPGGTTLVLLRHGQSAGNADNAFTGWLDPPLTTRGRREAGQAGELLVERGCAPVAVHTSVLARAVDTAAIVTGVLAVRGVRSPSLHRCWRLNERHYGSLQGRPRPDVLAEYGPEQLRRWRRGYREAPPPLSPDDPRHPVRDPRYAHLAAASLPGAESLADVVTRVDSHLPALAADLRRGPVLVVAHSNSLRALCLRLDGLDERAVEGLEVPTGVPLRYVFDAGGRPRVRGGEYLDPEAAAAGVAEVVAQAMPGDAGFCGSQGGGRTAMNSR
jgi:2,3-bisphosphoglycerate-dependent phosphoglycerate mutase